MTNQRCIKLWTRLTGAIALGALVTGCVLTDPQYRTEKHAENPQPRVNLDLQPGQLIEAVIIEPASTIKQRRVRARIDATGAIAFDTLGVYDTRGRSLSQLEQNMLNHLNHGRRLQGTLRLSLLDADVAMPTTH